MRDEQHNEQQLSDADELRDAATERVLDRLAAETRGEPGSGFEARLVAAARPGVAGKIDRTPSGRGLLGRSWWAIPVAAAVVCGVVLIRPIDSGPGSSPTSETALASLEADLDDFLFIDAFTDSQSLIASDDDSTDLFSDVASPSDTADDALFELFGVNGGAL